MKIFITIILLISSLFSANKKMPSAQFVSSGAVVDIVITNNRLYSATGAGCVDIFDMSSKKIVQKIELEQITDFMGDVIDSKVYSVDVLNEKILILSQAKKGARRVHIFKENKLELLIPYTQNLFIAKAKFIDENTILLGLLSNELISYDIQNKTQNWSVQISQSKFSDFVLNEAKTQVVVADESGDLKIHNTKDGSFIKKLSGENLDNVFQVDYKNGTIATAGQDRKMVLYNYQTTSAYSQSASFLIYSVGLSPSAALVAFASDENNNVTLLDTQTKKVLGVFGGNKMTLSNILFLNEKEFIVSSDDTVINLYTIK